MNRTPIDSLLVLGAILEGLLSLGGLVLSVMLAVRGDGLSRVYALLFLLLVLGFAVFAGRRRLARIRATRRREEARGVESGPREPR